MLQLLLSILALALSFGAFNNPQKTPQDLATQIQNHLPEALSHGAASESVVGNIPPTPGPNETAEESSESPDTTKVLTYNTESEHTVGEVPQVAVNNAPPLEPCQEGACEDKPGKSEVTPTPTPTPEVPPVVEEPPQPVPDPITPPNPCGPIITGVRPPLHPLIYCLGLEL